MSEIKKDLTAFEKQALPGQKPMSLIWAIDWAKPQAHFWAWWWTHRLDYTEPHDYERVMRKAQQAQCRLLQEHGVDPNLYTIEMVNAEVCGDSLITRVLAVFERQPEKFRLKNQNTATAAQER